MNINEIATLLLNDFSAEEREIPDNADFPGRNAEVLKAMNAGLQEVFGEGSPWIRFDEKGHLIHAPTTITLTVNTDGTAGLVTEGWEGWMAGCSIVIADDIGDNQIRSHVSASANAASYDFIGFELTAATAGADGNLISFERQVVAGSPVVTVTGNAIVLKMDSSDTYADAVAALEGSAEASALVNITANLAFGALTFAAISQTFLAGGYNQITLKTPYSGADGSKTATVYQDSVAVSNASMEVLEPVRFSGNQLAATATPNVTIPVREDQDYGFAGVYRMPSDATRISDSAGIPVAFSVVTWSQDSTTQPQTRIRLLPAPSEVGKLEYNVKLAPPAITDLESTDTLPIPQQFIQSIFYPICRKHLSGCPFFIHSTASAEIDRSYSEALRLLDKLKPGKNQGRVIRSIY